jgi:hypothetical protein
MTSSKTRGAVLTGVAGLRKELKAAEARWQERKRTARDAKIEAKEAKKAVKKVRKALAAAEAKASSPARKTSKSAKPRKRAGEAKRVTRAGPATPPRRSKAKEIAPEAAKVPSPIEVQATDTSGIETPDAGDVASETQGT